MKENRTENFSTWLKTHGVNQRGVGKMTPGELASAARISRASAYFYFNGTRVPDDPAVIARIAKVLHVAPVDLPAFEPKRTENA